MSAAPRRFVLGPDAVRGDRVQFDRAETRHLARVLRLRPGDVVEAFDGQGGRLTVRLTSLGAGAAEGLVVGRDAAGRESPLRLVLAQGLPKADKMDAIVRMATELGATRIAPVLTARTGARPDAARGRGRRLRWERVAREAAKQCGRAVVPAIAEPRLLADWLAARAPAGLLVCLWEAEPRPLASQLPTDVPSEAALVVGPEGGLTREEVEALRAAGAVVAGLGPRILRTETAGPVGLALLQARYGDLGR